VASCLDQYDAQYDSPFFYDSGSGSLAGSCGVNSVVVMSDAEYQLLASASPWNWSAAEGAQIAAAVLLVWGIGFAFRAVIRSLGSDRSTQEFDG